MNEDRVVIASLNKVAYLQAHNIDYVDILQDARGNIVFGFINSYEYKDISKKYDADKVQLRTRQAYKQLIEVIKRKKRELNSIVNALI